jgi:hypothetical protein
VIAFQVYVKWIKELITLFVFHLELVRLMLLKKDKIYFVMECLVVKTLIVLLATVILIMVLIFVLILI